MKKHLLRLTALTMVAGITFGTASLAGASGDVGIDTTGPESYNKIEHENRTHMFIKNDNELTIKNEVEQKAYGGEAKVMRNTTVGDVESGDASNSSNVATSISITNTAPIQKPSNNYGVEGTIDTTGPESYNKIEFENKTDIKVINDNDVYVKNEVEQKAYSGDAEAYCNTTVGDVESGDVSNTSNVATTVNITNN